MGLLKRRRLSPYLTPRGVYSNLPGRFTPCLFPTRHQFFLLVGARSIPWEFIIARGVPDSLDNPPSPLKLNGPNRFASAAVRTTVADTRRGGPRRPTIACRNCTPPNRNRTQRRGHGGRGREARREAQVPSPSRACHSASSRPMSR